MAVFQSFGAAETVTGSCHRLQLGDGTALLVDCGMFQGQDEARNREPFGFDPKAISAVLLTHAHLDHVGRLPRLVKEGFSGRIVATRATMELAEVVLMDSAHLMAEEYRTRYKKAQRRGEEESVPPPLYTMEDVSALYDLPITYAEYGETIELGHGIKATFRNAGHILGSSSVTLEIEEAGRRVKVVFSGDLGNRNDMVIPPPEPVAEADALFIESTYGDRLHKGVKDTEAEFRRVVSETLKRGGSVVIPSFAIERTQEILCLLKRMFDAKALPRCKVFLDSPMAIRATRLYDLYHTSLSRMCQRMLRRDGSLFAFSGLTFTQTPEESRAINDETGCIIIAGSGMCSGGRILHHLKHRLWNGANTVLFVGYQAVGTLGRRLVEGEKRVKIYHEEIVVRAQIHTVNGFSAHADRDELLAWMGRFSRLEKVYLVHGEPDKQALFVKSIAKELGKQAHIVKYGETITL